MRVSHGKWTKHKFMSKNEKLSSFLPETQYLTENSLSLMLDKYKQVMVKPCFGYQGKGIIMITRLNDEEFELHIGHQKIIISGKENIFEYLKQNHFSKKRQRYIVQQRIQLAAINNNPFDIRVMVQRKRRSKKWVITGKLAKVAAKLFVVTNVAKAVLPIEDVIEKSTINSEKMKEIIAIIDQISMITAIHLAQFYKRTRVFGLDIGLDQEGKVWIIEANLTPAASIFKKLNDGSYETIITYKRG
nr:YheC/YheD family protein [Neobacillus sp. Marseille-Q6967]